MSGLLELIEARIRAAERRFADDLNWTMYERSPLADIGPPRYITPDYANDPDWYMDRGFPHCWMPVYGSKAWRDAGGS